MKNWMKRFAILAVVGTILSSALLVGCGGGDEGDTGTANGANGAGGSGNAGG
jgi:hypothetical protein